MLPASETRWKLILTCTLRDPSLGSSLCAEKATLAEAQVPATSEEGEPFLITPGHGGGQPFAVRLKAKDYSSCVLELAPGETAALIGGSSSSASGSSASGSAGSSASSSAGSSASEAEHEAEAEALPPMTSTELAAGPPVHHGSHSFIKQVSTCMQADSDLR